MQHDNGTNNNVVLDFLTENWATNEGYACIWQKSGGQSYYKWPTEADELVRALADLNTASDAFIGWSLYDKAARGNVTASCVPGLLLDVDLSTGKHSRPDLPETPVEALALLEKAGFPEPSRVLHSGGGLYVEYLLSEPFNIVDELSRRRITQLTKGLTRRAMMVFKDNGRSLDYVADLARVTRVPGSINWKYGADRKVLTVQALGTRYTLEQLECLLAYESMPSALSSSPEHKAYKDLGEEERGDFDLVVRHCAFVRKLAEAPTKVTEPEWKAASTIAVQCKGGREEFDRLSALDKGRYDRDETRRKLEQSAVARPATCEHISGTLDFDGCQRCPFKAFNYRSPYALAHGNPWLLDLQSRFIFSADQISYYPISGDEPKREQSFTSQYRSGVAHAGLRGTPHILFTRDKRSPIVDRSEYMPGNPALIDIRPNGVKVRNSWLAGGVQSADGACDLIIGHLEYLVPDKGQLTWLLSYMASLVQQPAQKIKHAVMLIGRQGVGKSFLNGVLMGLFGDNNVFIDSGQIHASTYRRKMGNRQILVIEEMAASDRFEVSNELKPWITQERVEAHEKYDPVREVVTPRGIFIWSNRDVPAFLEDGDRRYFVLRSDSDPNPAIYYAKLFEEGGRQVPAFKSLLLEFDISGWSAEAPPPMTEAKEEVLLGSRSPLASEVQALIEEGRFPRDLVTVADIRRSLSFRPKEASDAKIVHALREIGARKLGRFRTSLGMKRPWVIRNFDRWLAATSEEVRLHLEGTVYPDGQVLSLINGAPKAAPGEAA